jgi:hypothetical protein
MATTRCDEPTINTQDTMELALSPLTKEAVVIARLNPSDLLVLETNTSRYEFTVLNPVRREGLLTGGKLAAHLISVKWSGTIIKNIFSDIVDQKVLSCGSRAIFHLVKGCYPNNFLVTSPVLRLVLQRNTH